MFRISFFVDDNKLADAMHAVAGKARNLEVVPVVNAIVGKNGKLQQEAGTPAEMFEREIRKRKLEAFPPTALRDICSTLGFKPTGYSYHLKQLIKAGVIVRIGKGRNADYKLAKS